MLAASPLITVGSHSAGHPILAMAPREEQHAQLCGSRRKLEAWIQRPVTALAYPNGRPGRDYTADTVSAAIECGFEHAFAIGDAFGGLAAGMTWFSQEHAAAALATDPGSRAGRLAGWATDVGNPLSLGLLTIFVFLLFPQGRLESRSQRRTGVVAVVGIATAMAEIPDLPRRWQTGEAPHALPEPVKWRDKTLTLLARMALIKRRMHALSRDRTRNVRYSPLWSLLIDRWRTRRTLRRYHAWLRQR